MRLLFLLSLFAGCMCGFAQNKSYDIHRTYTVAQVLEDIDYTETYLLKFHPDPFRYISRDSLHAFVEATKAKINRPLNEMQLRFYVKQIVAKIGCGHTDVAASKDYAKTVLKLSRPILPLNTFLLDDGRLIVINNLSKDSTILSGDEVTAIDGHPLNDILKAIFSVITTDGYNKTLKERGIRYEWFKYYYSFCYGFKPSYRVALRHANGTTSETVLDAISSLKDTLILPKKDSVTFQQKTRTCRYRVVSDSLKLALIDIDGFSGKHWNRFFRRTFRDIRRQGIDHLVIDLRDNGGGKINNGFNLLSYLIPKTIQVAFDRDPNLIPFSRRLRMDPASRITPLLFTFFMPEIPKHGRLRHFFFGFPKHRNAYHGKLYVLANGKSFSMSCVAAAYLKYKAGAVMLGEETGGNIAGSNAIINGYLRLPHSHIRVFIPVYHIYHDVNVENNGHGIMPDIPTHYSKDDVLRGTDVDLETVKTLVEEITAKPK